MKFLIIPDGTFFFFFWKSGLIALTLTMAVLEFLRICEIVTQGWNLCVYMGEVGGGEGQVVRNV